jgi:hypothetical protein
MCSSSFILGYERDCMKVYHGRELKLGIWPCLCVSWDDVNLEVQYRQCTVHHESTKIKTAPISIFFYVYHHKS